MGGFGAGVDFVCFGLLFVGLLGLRVSCLVCLSVNVLINSVGIVISFCFVANSFLVVYFGVWGLCAEFLFMGSVCMIFASVWIYYLWWYAGLLVAVCGSLLLLDVDVVFDCALGLYWFRVVVVALVCG